nr:C4-dicarboxylate transporter DcuC [Gammaproteobacteria bacterium]
NKLVEYAIKPLSKVKQPYFLLCGFYILGVFLNMFITSATGLGLLFMVTIFPILVGMGISKYSAVGMIVTTGCLELGPVQTNLIVSADLAKLEISDYFTSYQLPVAIPTMIAIAVGHFFWQQYCDKKMGHDIVKAKANPDYGDEELSSAEKSTAPWFYALFPLIPFVFVLLFSKIALSLGIDFGIKLGLTTVLFFSVAIIFIVDFICLKGDLKAAFDNFDYFLKGMATMLPVVTLVIAGTFFAKALLASGGIDILVDAASSSGLGAKGMTVVMVLIIMLVAALMGSGNASFIPLANIAPPVAAEFGVPAVAMLLPMQLISSMARVLSPIVAVSIACAGLARISTVDVVKRTSVPMLFGALVMIITSLIFI